MRESWIADHQQIEKWTLLSYIDSEYILCRCSCGVEKHVRYDCLLKGLSKSCRSCADKDWGKRRKGSEATKKQAKKASDAAAKANIGKSIYSEEEKLLKHWAQGARQRCTNKKSINYEDYGGRGIKFGFPNIREAIKWVYLNLGPRPTTGHSIDRIDNGRHYEPGNLRWATKEEQARNKRVYNGSVYGMKLKILQGLRPDYTYEGLRKYVKQGLSIPEIMALPKPRGGRPRKK